MNAEQILAELVAERDRISLAIEALGGRSTTTKRSSGQPGRTPEQRAAHAEKMRAYWAARKSGKKPKAKN